MSPLVHFEGLTPFDPFEVDAEVLTKLTDADFASGVFHVAHGST